MHLWKPEDVSLEAGLVLHLVSSGNRTQDVRLGGKRLYPREDDVLLRSLLPPTLKRWDYIAASDRVMGLEARALSQAKQTNTFYHQSPPYSELKICLGLRQIWDRELARQ